MSLAVQQLISSETKSLAAATTAQAQIAILSSTSSSLPSGSVLILEKATNLANSEPLLSAVRSTREVVATASNSSVQDSITEAIAEASYSITEQTQTRDFYGYDLSMGGNAIYLCLSSILFLYFIGMSFRSRYQWFNVCFVCAFGLEFVSYLGRVLAVNNHAMVPYFVMQAFRLSMVPQFLLAGIYVVFSQTAGVYGQKYTPLKPVWIPYIFTSMGIFSTIIAAIGGPLAPPVQYTGQMSKNFNVRINLMFCGELINAAVITTFIVFCIVFSYKTFFDDRYAVSSDSRFKSAGTMNFFKMLLNIPSARNYKRNCLDKFYSQRYFGIRSRPLFHFYPLAIMAAAILLLTRSIYRAIYTKLGYGSYLDTHELFLFLIETPLVILVGLIFVPFHPLFVFGRENVLRVVDLGLDDVSSPEKEENLGRTVVRDRDRFSMSAAVKPYTKRDRKEVLYIG